MYEARVNESLCYFQVDSSKNYRQECFPKRGNSFTDFLKNPLLYVFKSTLYIKKRKRTLAITVIYSLFALKLFDSGDNVKQRKNLLQFYPFVRDYPGFKGSGQSIRQVAMESSRSLQRYPKRSGHSERSMRTKANATFGRKGKSARLSIITFFFFKPSYLKSGKYKFL